MNRNDRAEVDRFLSDDSKWQEFLEMSKQATNAGRTLDGKMKLAYSHEEYIKMEKVLYSSWIDYYKQYQWSTLADNFEEILIRCKIATDTQWLNYLRNRKVPDGLRKELSATFFNCIQSGIDEERKLPGTEEEIKFYLVKKQAQSGDPNAMVTLSKMYLQGNGCYRDKEEALIWLKKAAKAGNAEAKLILDEIRLKGVERPLRRRRTIESNNKQEHDNKQDQEKKFQEEKKENDPKHWLKLANDTRRAGNYEEAISYYKRAIELGSTEAEGALSGLERMLDQKNIAFKNNIASKNKKSGCFITTAVCDSFRKSDNCYELTSFRFFRDNWLIDQLDGASLIAEYYSIAPKIVDKINRLKNSGEIYQSIWDEWLSSCLKLIEQGRNEDCKIRYINMVNYLKKTFLAN